MQNTFKVKNEITHLKGLYFVYRTDVTNIKNKITGCEIPVKSFVSTTPKRKSVSTNTTDSSNLMIS